MKFIIEKNGGDCLTHLKVSKVFKNKKNSKFLGKNYILDCIKIKNKFCYKININRIKGESSKNKNVITI